MKKLVPKRRFEEFKDSEAWEQRNFFDNIKNTIDFRGRTPRKLGLNWSKTGYLALSALNVKNGYIDSDADAHYGNQELYDKWMTGCELRKGQVLFTTEAPMGNVVQVPDNKGYILSQRTIAFDVNTEKITDDFLAVLLRSPKTFKELTALSSGGTAKGVSQKSLSQLKVTVPTSLEEQTKIGTLFVALDNFITIHQRKLKKLRNLKLAYLSEMFPKDGELYPKRRFAGFTDPWEQLKLSEFAEKAVDNRGKTPPIDVNGTHPLIEVASLGNGSPNYSKVEKYLNDYSFEHHLRGYIKKGDILFSTVGSIGLVSLMDDRENAAIAQNIVAFRAKEEYSPEYLYALFSTETNKAKAYRIVMGAVQPSIKVSQLVEVEYFVTRDKKEQDLIGKLFNNLDNLITLQQRKLEKLEALKQAYLSEMFI